MNIQALKETAEKATPGKWRKGKGDDFEHIVVAILEGHEVTIASEPVNIRVYESCTLVDGAGEEANIDHIATFSPQTVLAMIRVIEAFDVYDFIPEEEFSGANHMFKYAEIVEARKALEEL